MRAIAVSLLLASLPEALSGQLPSAKLPASLDKAEESIREERDKVIKDGCCHESQVRLRQQFAGNLGSGTRVPYY